MGRARKAANRTIWLILAVIAAFKIIAAFPRIVVVQPTPTATATQTIIVTATCQPAPGLLGRFGACVTQTPGSLLDRFK